MANTFNLGNGNWAQKTEKLLAYNAENDNYKPLPFDFDRASTATRVNKQGLIETVGVDKPRIDFLNNSKGHLLLEPSRQNLVTYSEDFSGWDKTGLTVSSNQIISPDGSLNADEINITAANSHYLFDTISVSASTNYTFTFYVKKGTATDVSYSILNATNFTNIVNTTSYFNEISNTGWTRITVGFTTPAGCTSVRPYPLRDGSSTGTVYIWGAQIEAGSYATSYIPTSGSAVTRSADARTDVALPSSILSQTEGTIFFNINRKGSTGIANQELIVLETPNRSSGGLIRVFTQTAKNVIRVLFQINGGIPFDVNVQGIYTPLDTDLKIAIAFKSGQTAIYINGVSTNTSTSTFTIPEKFDNFYLNFSQEAATFKDIKLYNTRLSNSELQSLTS